jgi:hypothetical protein
MTTGEPALMSGHVGPGVFLLVIFLVLVAVAAVYVVLRLFRRR